MRLRALIDNWIPALVLLAITASAPLHAQPGTGPISGGGGGGGGEATSAQGSATLPATCTEKAVYQDTNSGGTEFYICTATNTWTKTIAATDVPAAETDAAHDTAAEVGAVALQGSTPGSAQTGSANITGTAIVGTAVIAPSHVGGTSGSSTLSLDGDSTVTGAATVTTDGRIVAGVNGSSTSPVFKLFGGVAGMWDDWGTGGVAITFVNGTSFSVLMGTTYKMLLDTDELTFQTGHRIGWGVIGGAQDAGFARVAAGVIRASDGNGGIRGLLGGGAAVASATAMPVPTGRVFHVTGTTTITSITSTNFQSGACVMLIFDDALTFTDGSNLKISGDFVTTADDTISLCYDGTNWHEASRSVN